MRFHKPALVAAGLLLAATLAAQAQQPYQRFPYYQLPPPPMPPSWSYDPYTSGLGPCPQRWPGDPPCSYTMQPTYGQPSYWPVPR